MVGLKATGKVKLGLRACACALYLCMYADGCFSAYGCVSVCSVPVLFVLVCVPVCLFTRLLISYPALL